MGTRQPSGTVHHSDKGSQYISLACMQRLKEAHIESLLEQAAKKELNYYELLCMALQQEWDGREQRVFLTRRPVRTYQGNRSTIAEKAKYLILIPLHFSQPMLSTGKWADGIHKVTNLFQQLPH